MSQVLNRDLDSGQLPDWEEFERISDGDTIVRPKEGFSMGFGFAASKWRLREDADVLYVERWNGTAWLEQARFEA